MNRQETATMILETSAVMPEDNQWEPSKKRDILLRMLNNLTSEAVSAQDPVRLLRYLTAQIALEPDRANPRIQRFYLLTRAGRKAEAEADAAWLLEHRPAGTDAEELERLLRQ